MALVLSLGLLGAPAACEGPGPSWPPLIPGSTSLATPPVPTRVCTGRAGLPFARAWAARLPSGPSVQLLPDSVDPLDHARVSAWVAAQADQVPDGALVWLEGADPLGLGGAHELCAHLRARGHDISWCPDTVTFSPAGDLSGQPPGDISGLHDIDALERQLGCRPDLPSWLQRAIPRPLGPGAPAPAPPTTTHVTTGRSWGACEGRRVASTHAPVPGRPPFVRVVAALGMTGTPLPCLAVHPADDLDALDAAAAELSTRGAILTSAPGVQALAAALERVHGGPEEAWAALAAARTAAVGPRTASTLEARGVTPTLVAQDAHGEGLWRALEASGRAHEPWSLFRADQGSDTLLRMATEAGGDVRLVRAYRVKRPDVSPEEVRARLWLAAGDRDGDAPLDAICITSGRAARHLVALLGDALGEAEGRRLLTRVPLISIGPVTTGAMAALDLVAAATATRPTSAGLVDALRELWAC